MNYVEVLQGLQKAGVDYLVVGGLAVNFHGVPRMTYDVDIMIGLDRENVLRTVDLLEQWGYRPRVPVSPRDLADPAVRARWRDEKNMRALSFHHDKSGIGEIDLVFEGPREYEELRRASVRLPLGSFTVPVIGLPDLLSMKESAGRSQDRSDVEALRKISGTER